MPALYLALDFATAVSEANQGFAHKLDPCTLVAYEIDCEDIADLRNEPERREYSVRLTDMRCAWLAIAASGKTPPSWDIADRLIARSIAGILVPSFAQRAQPGASNLVLWKWGAARPHRVSASDPGGKLPRNQLSWK